MIPLPKGPSPRGVARDHRLGSDRWEESFNLRRSGSSLISGMSSTGRFRSISKSALNICDTKRERDFPEAEEVSRDVLSLPIFPELSGKEVEQVAGEIARFFQGQ